MQRAHPAQRIRARGGRAPAHGFRPGEALDDRRQDFRQHVERRPAGPLDDGDVELALALGVFLDLRLIDAGEAGAFQKAQQGLFGRANARTLALLARVGLAGGQAGDVQGETAGRREGGRALVEHAARDQRVGDEFLEVGRRLRLHARGNFLGEQFK